MRDFIKNFHINEFFAFKNDFYFIFEFRNKKIFLKKYSS